VILTVMTFTQKWTQNQQRIQLFISYNYLQHQTYMYILLVFTERA